MVTATILAQLEANVCLTFNYTLLQSMSTMCEVIKLRSIDSLIEAKIKGALECLLIPKEFRWGKKFPSITNFHIRVLEKIRSRAALFKRRLRFKYRERKRPSFRIVMQRRKLSTDDKSFFFLSSFQSPQNHLSLERILKTCFEF